MTDSDRRHRGEGSFGEGRRRGEERGGDGRSGGGDGRNETDYRRRGDGPPPNWEYPMDDRRGPCNDRSRRATPFWGSGTITTRPAFQQILSIEPKTMLHRIAYKSF
jgi:hypothetical protein